MSEDNPPYITVQKGPKHSMAVKMEYRERSDEYYPVSYGPALSNHHQAELWAMAWAEREGLEYRA